MVWREQAEPDVGVTNLTVNYLHCGAEQTLPPSSVTDWMQRRYPLRLPVDRVGTVSFNVRCRRPPGFLFPPETDLVELAHHRL